MQIKLIKHWFLRRGENQSTWRKTPCSRVENLQTHPTRHQVYKLNLGHNDGKWATNHCTSPAPQIWFKKLLRWFWSELMIFVEWISPHHQTCCTSPLISICSNLLIIFIVIFIIKGTFNCIFSVSILDNCWSKFMTDLPFSFILFLLQSVKQKGKTTTLIHYLVIPVYQINMLCWSAVKNEEK